MQDASFGILCVTKDNLSSSWLNFEAGALSKSLDQSKVCPFLVDLKPSEIQNNPILQFQMTSFSQDEMKKLFKSINENMGDQKVSEEILTTSFEAFWPKIQESLQRIIDDTEINKSTKKSVKGSQIAIEEMLELIRYQHRLLKTPEELLPPHYLQEVFSRINKNISKEDLFELAKKLHMLDELLSDIIQDFSQDDSNVVKRQYIKKLSNIQMGINRMYEIMRRKIVHIDRMFI